MGYINNERTDEEDMEKSGSGDPNEKKLKSTVARVYLSSRSHLPEATYMNYLSNVILHI